MAPARRAPSPATTAVVALVVAVVVVRVVAVALILGDGVDHPLSILGGDARRYLDILHGPGAPYRDHAVEYPPLTLGFTALLQGADLFGTQVRLAVSQLALEAAVAAVLAWAWGRRVGVAYLVIGTPMALYPFPYFRVDLVSTFLAVAGLALARRRWPAAGGAVLGLALFAKVWPVVLAPALAVGRRWRGVAALAAVAVAGGVAWVAWGGLDGPVQVATFRGADGWQVESVIGIFLHLADPGGTSVEQGAWRTAAAVPGPIRLALPALALGGAAAAWLLAERARRRGRPDPGVVVEGWAPLAAVLCLLVASSIISPQYLVWATPFAAVVAARASRPVGAAFMAAGALSALGLAFIHPLTRGELWAGGLVIARNAVLVGLLVACFVRLARPGPARGGPQPTPKAMMARMSDTDATRSIDEVSSGMP